jgi:hypothetical protein
VATIAAAARNVSPPDHVRIRKGDMPFWDSVISEKPKSEWTESDLIVAANLARAMADSERVAGYTVVGGGNINQRKLLETIEVSDKLRPSEQVPPHLPLTARSNRSGPKRAVRSDHLGGERSAV